MTTDDVSCHGSDCERPFTLVSNAAAVRSGHWTAEQDSILNDAAADRALETISSWPDYSATVTWALPSLALGAGVASIHYKDEAERFGLGSFKALGGAYAVTRLLQRELSQRLHREVPMSEINDGTHRDLTKDITVCCATDGNHGRSVAWGAQTFGCRCVIFIHSTVSEGRKDAIARYGAEVRRCSGNYDDSVREAQQTARQQGWHVVSDTSYPGYMEVPKDVMQGYEIMAIEAFEQLDQPPTHIFLQTGVGGMAAAVAAAAVRRWGESRPRIVLVDPEDAACWVESYRHNRPVAVSGSLDTLMAGLACGECSALAWEILQHHADAAMAIPDKAAVEMMCRLANPDAGDPVIVAGESAVAGLGGLFAAMSDPRALQALELGPASRVLVFGTEGDTDPRLYETLVGVSADAVRARAT